jgi:hypothetical protein
MQGNMKVAVIVDVLDKLGPVIVDSLLRWLVSVVAEGPKSSAQLSLSV